MNPLGIVTTVASSWLNPGRWLLYGGLVVALFVGFQANQSHQQDIGEERATLVYNAKISKLNADAAAVLVVETAKAHTATAKLLALNVEQNTKDAKTKTTLDRLNSDLVVAAGANSRLRDPNADGASGGGGCGPHSAATSPAPGGSPDGAEAGGLLSRSLTTLLLEQAKAADQINLAYSSCKADAISIRLTP